MLEKVAACTPALTGFVAKCQGKGPASAFFWTDSGERTQLECSGGVHQRDAVGPALFCLRQEPMRMRAREDPESQGTKAYA